MSESVFPTRRLQANFSVVKDSLAQLSGLEKLQTLVLELEHAEDTFASVQEQFAQALMSLGQDLAATSELLLPPDDPNRAGLKAEWSTVAAFGDLWQSVAQARAQRVAANKLLAGTLQKFVTQVNACREMSTFIAAKRADYETAVNALDQQTNKSSSSGASATVAKLLGGFTSSSSSSSAMVSADSSSSSVGGGAGIGSLAGPGSSGGLGDVGGGGPGVAPSSELLEARQVLEQAAFTFFDSLEHTVAGAGTTLLPALSQHYLAVASIAKHTHSALASQHDFAMGAGEQIAAANDRAGHRRTVAASKLTTLNQALRQLAVVPRHLESIDSLGRVGVVEVLPNGRECHGFLQLKEKRRGPVGGGNWERRWFVIRSGTLSWHKSWDDFAGDGPQGELALLFATARVQTASGEDRGIFEVISRSKNLVLQAGSAAAMRQWMTTIQNAISAELNEVSADRDGPSGGGGSGGGMVKSALDPKQDPASAYNLFRGYSAANCECADCGAPDPEWASLNFGISLCIACSGVHRFMGVTVSKVRSLTLDTWDQETLLVMQNVGNAVSNSVFESELEKRPVSSDSSREEREQFIVAKYKETLFVAHSKRPKGDLSAALYAACKVRDIPRMIVCRALGGDLNWRCPSANGSTVLHAAAQTNDLFAIEWSLLNGASVNAQNSSGQSPLHLTAQSDKLSGACRLLLQRSASLTVRDSAGRTALEVATHAGSAAGVCQKLIKLAAAKELDQNSMAASTDDTDTSELGGEGSASTSHSDSAGPLTTNSGRRIMVATKRVTPARPPTAVSGRAERGQALSLGRAPTGEEQQTALVKQTLLADISEAVNQLSQDQQKQAAGRPAPDRPPPVPSSHHRRRLSQDAVGSDGPPPPLPSVPNPSARLSSSSRSKSPVLSPRTKSFDQTPLSPRSSSRSSLRRESYSSSPRKHSSSGKSESPRSASGGGGGGRTRFSSGPPTRPPPAVPSGAPPGVPAPPPPVASSPAALKQQEKRRERSRSRTSGASDAPSSSERPSTRERRLSDTSRHSFTNLHDASVSSSPSSVVPGGHLGTVSSVSSDGGEPGTAADETLSVSQHNRRKLSVSGRRSKSHHRLSGSKDASADDDPPPPPPAEVKGVYKPAMPTVSEQKLSSPSKPKSQPKTPELTPNSSIRQNSKHSRSSKK